MTGPEGPGGMAREGRPGGPAGPLNLIHTNNSPNPASMRVPGRLADGRWYGIHRGFWVHYWMGNQYRGADGAT